MWKNRLVRNGEKSIPMPGTAKHSLQHDSPDMGFSCDATEQSRICESHAWGKWNHKLCFHAYPATVCQLQFMCHSVDIVLKH